MKLGILETGRPARSLESFGDYPSMFRAMLGEERYAFETYAVCDGVFPETVDAQDAWLITGASTGVYDPEPWIPPLFDFLRAAKGRIPLVGVCFGHQAMAEAFGGKVVKSPKGWGVGLHRYDIEARSPWMDAAPAIAIPAWHQDQVVTLPPGAVVAGGNAFCPFGLLDYGDAISIQLHPEFDPDFVKAGLRRDKMGLTSQETQAAIDSLDVPNDNNRMSRWIGEFLESGRYRSGNAG